MHRDVEALLALQADDATIHELEGRLASLEPRLLDLERQRQVAADALSRARQALEAEERRQRDLQTRFAQHKQLQERNLAQLDQVRSLRESTAAMSQVDQVRRILADEENELSAISRRMADLRHQVDVQQGALAQLERDQESQRHAVDEERGRVDEELGTARRRRAETAAKVAPARLSKYDRILRRRRKDVLFALRGPSCSNCDTAIPIQRRNQMATTGAIEMCEACGVLLYATS